MKKLATLLLMLLGITQAHSTNDYLPRVYPQQQEAVGAAQLSVDTEAQTTLYTFRNALFEARFRQEGNVMTFDGCEAMNLMPGTELFTVKLGDGATVVNASKMTLTDVQTGDLPYSDRAVKGAHHFPGKFLQATFTHRYASAGITFVWRAELRDGSHYLRTDLTMTSDHDVKFYAILPMQYNVDAKAAGSTPRVSGNTRGSVIVSDRIFAGLETPTGYNTVGSEPQQDIDPSTVVKTWTASWTPSSWTAVTTAEFPARLGELGFTQAQMTVMKKQLTVSQKGDLVTEFLYASGSHRLNLAGVDLVDADGNIVASDYHIGYTGGQKDKNIYSFSVPYTGTFTLRSFVETRTETITSSGNITIKLCAREDAGENDADIVPVQGLWSRDAKLLAYNPANVGKDMVWNVSSVVGLVNPDHIRRSILAYSERERAVPWRAFPLYNSWYEININHNNFADPSQNMNVKDCAAIVEAWKENLFDRYGVGIKSFVWDDGWDVYGTWDHHAGFPHGFKECALPAAAMTSGTGAWLGPVGGYGGSGTYRRNYWNGKGGMQLSNPDYYNVFKNSCVRLVSDEPRRDGYEFNFFKFDGISAQFSSKGPDEGSTGNENAEGIITCERFVRENVKEDVFFNTSVGTWASPFWFHFTDAVWRQENDYGTIGNNSIDREKWITYRDRLVYQNFVQGAPYCPINTLMTHGFIFTTKGSVSKNLEYEPARRELRCAFACGSGMVELYADQALLSGTAGGALWKDLADCIRWQRENADVLPDIHWVGGNPWTGSAHEVYGWAAWNGVKAVLTLRNGDNNAKTFKFRLRQVLDIPADVTSGIVLRKAFADQAALRGLQEGEALDLDKEFTVTLPGSSVFIFNGTDTEAVPVKVQRLAFDEEAMEVLRGKAMAPAVTLLPLDASCKTLAWSSDDEEVASVTDGCVTGRKVGTATITARTTDGSGLTASIRITVLENRQFDMEELILKAQAAYDANEVDTYGDNLITRNTQFSSNATETSEGSLNNLLDGNAATFWHSTWKGVSGSTMNQHYLQVQVAEPVDGIIRVTQVTRSDASNDFVRACRVDASTNGVSYATIGSVTFPGVDKSSAGKTFRSAFTAPQPYKYFRFYISETTNNRVYGHFAEFQLNKLVEAAANAQFPEVAKALSDALTQARQVVNARQEDIDALQQALDDYLEAIRHGIDGIRTPSASAHHAPTATYDLQGRPVSQPTHGIYIRQGQKIALPCD